MYTCPTLAEHITAHPETCVSLRFACSMFRPVPGLCRNPEHRNITGEGPKYWRRRLVEVPLGRMCIPGKRLRNCERIDSWAVARPNLAADFGKGRDGFSRFLVRSTSCERIRPILARVRRWAILVRPQPCSHDFSRFRGALDQMRLESASFVEMTANSGQARLMWGWLCLILAGEEVFWTWPPDCQPAGAMTSWVSTGSALLALTWTKSVAIRTTRGGDPTCGNRFGIAEGQAPD